MKLLSGLKRWPLSPFLVVVFAFVHAYNYSYRWMRIPDILDVLFYSLLICAALYGVLYFLFRSHIKTAVLTALTALSFFYIGFLQDWVQKITDVSIQFRYAIPGMVGLLGILFLMLRRTQEEKLVRFNYFLNSLFLIYILVDIGIVSYKHITLHRTKLGLVEELPLRDSTVVKSAIENPDVYFLVFDEYSSSVSLKENYGYDNSALDSFLIHNGFYLASHAKSNYTFTIFSLGSTLNMNYFKRAEDMKFPDDFGLIWDRLYFNKVFREFGKRGYGLYNYSSLNIMGNPPLNDNFSRHWAIKYIFGKSAKTVFDLVYRMFDKKHYTRKLNESLADFERTVRNTDPKPRFVYFHTMLPHTPYVFDANGQEKLAGDYTKWESVSIKGYLDQLTFTNSVIKKVVTEILKSPRPKLIILEGDHGNRYYPKTPAAAYKKYLAGKNAFKNLNAYWFPDKDYHLLHDSISPVNSFRVVLSQYFEKPMDLLRDSSVY